VTSPAPGDSPYLLYANRVVRSALGPILNPEGDLADNLLFYGDNLDVLRRHIKDETIDLVYLDPPFNSDQSYNVLFAERDGHQAAAQIQAFEDSWRWDEGAARQFHEAVEQGGKVSEVLQAFRLFLGDSDMLTLPRLRGHQPKHQPPAARTHLG